MNEKQLVKQILEGDEKAKRKFYKKYKDSLLTVVKRKAKNPKDAQDIVQETFISALNSLPNFEFRSSLFSWLCSIAHHETVDYYRKEKLKTILFSKFPFLKDWADQSLGPEGDSLKQELKEEIKNILAELSEGYEQILRLKYIEGLSMKAIAKRLKISPKAVESKLYRARKKFRQVWDQS
jgi:RNA polymerase sigma-70 factor (ECF subfamily)